MIKDVMEKIKETLPKLSAGAKEEYTKLSKKVSELKEDGIKEKYLDNIKETLPKLSAGAKEEYTKLSKKVSELKEDGLPEKYKDISLKSNVIVDGTKEVVVEISTGIKESYDDISVKANSIFSDINVKLMGSYEEIEAYEKAKEAVVKTEK